MAAWGWKATLVDRVWVGWRGAAANSPEQQAPPWQQEGLLGAGRRRKNLCMPCRFYIDAVAVVGRVCTQARCLVAGKL